MRKDMDMDEWRPIETAPKTGEWFMTYTPGDEPYRLYDFACWLPESEGWGKVRCGFQYATHWRPLPPPPQGPRP